MTVVVVGRFSEGGAVVADSRATWRVAQGDIPQDELQKILYVDKRIALAYAGDVAGAARIVRAARVRLTQSPRLRDVRTLAPQLSRIARFEFAEYLKGVGTSEGVELFLAGVTSAGDLLFARYRSPSFAFNRISTPFSAIGSGAAAVLAALAREFPIIERDGDSLKNKADRLRSAVEAALTASVAYGVGGLLQSITLAQDGIRPMSYGEASFDPDDPGAARAMSMKAGTWTQHDLLTGVAVPLREPAVLLRGGVKELRVADYEPPTPAPDRASHWLSYLFLCQKFFVQPGDLIVEGVFSRLVVPELPVTVPAIAALGIWGIAGSHDVAYVIEKGERRTEVLRQRINIDVPMEGVDVGAKVQFECDEPGCWFLDVVIGGRSVGRQPFWVAVDQRVRSGQGSDVEAALALAEWGLLGSVDPVVEVSGAELQYLMLAQSIQLQSSSFVVARQPLALYSVSYPLTYQFDLATGLRLPRGSHQLRVSLQNMANRQSSLVDTATVESDASAEVTKVLGRVALIIPEPGWYFVNLEVGGRRLGTAVFAAETDQAKYSYSLRDEDAQSVAAGQLLIVVRRSSQAPKSDNAEPQLPAL